MYRCYCGDDRDKVISSITPHPPQAVPLPLKGKANKTPQAEQLPFKGKAKKSDTDIIPVSDKFFN